MSLRDKGFALSLIVGIEDHFGKQSKAVKTKARDLEKTFHGMQATMGKVESYKKAKAALEALEKAENKNIDALKRKRQEVRTLSRALEKAGLDTDNLALSEKRLAKQAEEANQAFKKQSQTLSQAEKAQRRLGQLAGTTVAAGTAAIYAKIGDDTNRARRTLANRTNLSYDTLNSQEEKDWLRNQIQSTGKDAGEVYQARELSEQQTQLTDKQRKALTEQALKFQKVYGGDIAEITRAISTAMTTQGLSAEKTANLISSAFSNGANKYGDLLDTINEYSQYMDKGGIGFDKQLAIATIAQQSGAQNADKPMDMLKEAFQARLSDTSEMEKLFGVGKKAGELDTYVSDPKLRKQLKDSVYQYRQALATGTGQGDALKGMAATLSNLNQQDPANAKVINERIFGTIGSEDIGGEGLQKILGVLSGKTTTESILKSTQTLNERADNIGTSFDKASNAIKSLSQPLAELASTVEDSVRTLANGVSTASSGAGGVLGSSPWLTGGLMVGGAILGGIKARGMFKVGKKALNYLGGGIKGAKETASNSGRLASTLNRAAELVNGSGALDIAKRGASSLGKVTGAATSLGKKVLSKAPIIGAGINTLMIGSDITDNNWRGVAGDVGSILGGLLGGAGGSLLMPGAGTLAGGVAGSMGGEELANQLYDWLAGTDKPEDVKDTEATINAMSQTANKAGLAMPLPPIEVIMQNTIQIQGGETDEQTAQSLISALRDLTPELQAQLKATFEDILDHHDNALIR